MPNASRLAEVLPLKPEILPLPAAAPGQAPVVGYLVLAPAGTDATELLSAVRAEFRTPPARAAVQPRPLPEPPAPAAPPGVAVGVAVDAEGRTVTVDGRALELTYLEYELLALLVAHPHRVFTRDQLVTTVWGYGPVGDRRTVDVHIARLRRKLGAVRRDEIVTVHRVGYKYAPAR